VLMSNHVHLLATPRGRTGMPRTMHWTGGVFAQYLNAKYGRTGSRFEGRYRAAVVHDEAYLLTCMRYVELNPVRAGIVVDPAGYPWSSFRANALGEADELVTRHPMFHDLGHDADQRQRAYRELFRGAIPDSALHAIRRATRHGWALGNDAFVRRVSEHCRRAAPLRVRTVRRKA
jgi:putative transposase